MNIFELNDISVDQVDKEYLLPKNQPKLEN